MRPGDIELVIDPKQAFGTGHHATTQLLIERLEELAGGDHSFVIEFIDTFLNGAPKMLGELRQSLENGDAATLRRVAHTLKSNTAALGATRLSELCKELEHLGKNETLDLAPDRVGLVELEFEPVKSALESIRGGYGK